MPKIDHNELSELIEEGNLNNWRKAPYREVKAIHFSEMLPESAKLKNVTEFYTFDNLFLHCKYIVANDNGHEASVMIAHKQGEFPGVLPFIDGKIAFHTNPEIHMKYLAVLLGGRGGKIFDPSDYPSFDDCMQASHEDNKLDLLRVCYNPHDVLIKYVKSMGPHIRGFEALGKTAPHLAERVIRELRSFENMVDYLSNGDIKTVEPLTFIWDGEV